EGQRVEIIVVHAAVDHVYAGQAANRLHVDDVAIHHQVAPLHQLDAHLLREETVLEIGAIVNAGREQHDDRRAVAAGRERAMDLEAPGRLQADHLPPEMLAVVNQRAGDAAVFEDALRSVYVLQEQVECKNALAQAALDVTPLGAGQDARNQVEGEESFSAAAV